MNEEISMWYDRKGKIITAQEAEKFLRKKDYQIIKQQKIGSYFVSTVWMGVDHNYFFWKRDDPEVSPIIFETMIFDKDDSCYVERYSTEEESLIGHEKAVKIAQEWEDKGKNEKTNSNF